MLDNIQTTVTSIAQHDECMKQLLSKNYRLYPVDTIRQRDYSAPRIEKCGYVSRKYDRSELMADVRTGENALRLRHVSTRDCSAPRVDASVHIRFVERKDFLNSVLDGASYFYSNLIDNIKRTGFASQAQMKANELYLAGQNGVTEIAHQAPAVANWAQKTGYEAMAKAPAMAYDATSWAQKTGYDAMAKVPAMAYDATNWAQKTGYEATSQATKMGSNLMHSMANAAGNIYASGLEKLSEIQQKMHIEHSTQTLLDIKAMKVVLNHVRSKDIHDRSRPFLPSNYALQTTKANSLLARQVDLKAKLNKDLNKARSRSLNHVVMVDRSQAIIPEKVNLVPSERSKLLREVKVTDHSTILHPTVTCDKSQPQIPAGKVDVFKNMNRKALLDEVKWGKALEKNALVKDKSAPILASAPTM